MPSYFKAGIPRRDKVLSILRKERNQVLRAFGISLDALYGSVAKNRATLDSDIDVFSKSTEAVKRDFERAEEYLTSVFQEEGLIPNSRVEISSSKSGNWRFLKHNKKDMLEIYPGALQDIFTSSKMKRIGREYEEDEIGVLYWVNEAVISLEEAVRMIEELLDRHNKKAGQKLKDLRTHYFAMKSRLSEISRLDINQLPFRHLRGKGLRREPRPANLSQIETSELTVLAYTELLEFEKARDSYLKKLEAVFTHNDPLFRFDEPLQGVHSRVVRNLIYHHF